MFPNFLLDSEINGILLGHARSFDSHDAWDRVIENRRL